MLTSGDTVGFLVVSANSLCRSQPHAIESCLASSAQELVSSMFRVRLKTLLARPGEISLSTSLEATALIFTIFPIQMHGFERHFSQALDTYGRSCSLVDPYMSTAVVLDSRRIPTSNTIREKAVKAIMASRYFHSLGSLQKL